MKATGKTAAQLLGSKAEPLGPNHSRHNEQLNRIEAKLDRLIELAERPMMVIQNGAIEFTETSMKKPGPEAAEAGR